MRNLKPSSSYRQKVEQWLPGAEGESRGNNCIVDPGFQFYKTKGATGVGGGDGRADVHGTTASYT